MAVTRNRRYQAGMWRKDFAQVVKNALAEARAKNSKLSLRGYAKQLGLSITALTDILEGAQDWKITEARAKEILDRLDVDEFRRNHLKAQMNIPVEYSTALIPPEDASILSDRNYLAVAVAYDLPSSLRSDPRIAEMLDISVDEVQRITQVLLDRGHLLRSPDGTVSRSKKFWTTSAEVSPDAIKAHHIQGLRIAEMALHRVEPSRRMFGTLTFAGNSKNFERVKEELRLTEEKIVALLDEEPHNEIFQLQVLIHPLTFGKK